MELLLLAVLVWAIKKGTDAENIWDTFHMHPDELYADDFPMENQIV